MVLGGGPIGRELGQAFARLGSQVTLYPWIRKIKNRVAFWNGIEIVPD